MKNANTTANKAADAINDVLKLFEEGNLPKAMSYAVHPTADVPCSSYSFGNRIILALCGTWDARGFKAWKEVDRHVKKGACAIRIFAPNTKTIKDIDDNTGEEVKKSIVTGFRAIPVFAQEDTEGEPLDYQTIPLPDLRLLDVAGYLGIKVESIPAQPDCYGFYSPFKDKIALATDEECVFFHELAHAIHYRVMSDAIKAQIVDGQCPLKETVAELTAATLGYMLNVEVPTMGNHFRYIKRYADEKKVDVFKMCNLVFGEVEAIVNEIFRVREELDSNN